MRKIISLFALILIWFASAGAGAWLIMTKTELVKEPTEEEDPLAEATAGETQTPPATDDQVEEKPTPELPIPVRTKPISADEAFRLSARLRGEQEVLRLREQRIEKEESRLQIIRNDIALEQQEIEGLLGQIQSALKNAREVSDDIELQRQELEEKEAAAGASLQQMQVAKETVDEAVTANLKQMSQWLEGMTPQNGAQWIRDMIDDGEMGYVNQMLGDMDAKQVSKILEALEDTALAAEIAARFAKRSRPVKKKRR